MENLYKVEIDFDEASKAWRANKVKKDEGFEYRCGLPKKNGEPCKGHPRKKRLKDTSDFKGEWGPCARHRK